jgi:ATP-dependent protease Clp ATPase subunit
MEACNFCRKNKRDVKYLIQGGYENDPIYICSECVTRCTSIIAEENYCAEKAEEAKAYEEACWESKAQQLYASLRGAA